VSGTGITVTAYAHAVDLEVAGPTIAAVLQSGIISGPASAIATAASAYTSNVKVGPYAKAIKVGATLVASVARMFGFSNSPVTSDVIPHQNKVYHAFANTETRMPIDKLALDPNNEVTLDNRVAGIDPVDELDITSIVTRPSFIGMVDWTEAKTTGARLCFGKVSPSMFGPTTFTEGTYFNPTPAGWVAEMFRFWRGGMRYYFKVVRSRYQKGRLIFNWDPNGLLDAADVETALFSKVFDLSSDEQGFEVVIPYKAAPPWLKVGNIAYFSTAGVTYSSSTTNGNWQLAVVNPLTGAALANTVSILVYASACDDMEFAAPRALPDYYATEVQSGPMDGSALAPVPHLNDFTVGESIKSLRVLLHRTTLSTSSVIGAADVNTGYVTGRYHLSSFFQNIPPEPGFLPNLGFNQAKGGKVPATVKRANFCKMHPINWILTAFAGYRGSVNVHAVVSSNGLIENMNEMSISRIDHTPIVDSSKRISNNLNTGIALTSPIDGEAVISVNEYWTGATPLVPSGGGGITVTQGRTQMALSANIPQYCPARFWPAWYTQRYNFPVLGNIYDGFRVDTVCSLPENMTAGTAWGFPGLKVYWSAGVDFNTVFFTGVPRLQTYTMTQNV